MGIIIPIHHKSPRNLEKHNFRKSCLLFLYILLFHLRNPTIQIHHKIETLLFDTVVLLSLAPRWRASTLSHQSPRYGGAGFDQNKVLQLSQSYQIIILTTTTTALIITLALTLPAPDAARYPTQCQQLNLLSGSYSLFNSSNLSLLSPHN